MQNPFRHPPSAMGSQAASYDPSANRGRGYRLTNYTASGSSSPNKENESSAPPPTAASAASLVNNSSYSENTNDNNQNNHNNNRSTTSSPIPPATTATTATNAAMTPTTNININNLSPSVPSRTSITSSRSALGVTPGWGIGLSHSGTYLSTSVRTSSTIPLLAEEPSTYNAIKSILYNQKLVEITAAKEAQMAKQKQQQARLARERETKYFQREMEREKRKKKFLDDRREEKERVASQLEASQAQLQELMKEREELEKSIKAEWKTRIENYKEESLKKQEEEVKKLEEEHYKEVEQLTEEARVENEKDDTKLKQFIVEMFNGGIGRSQKNDKNTTREVNGSENKEKKKRNLSDSNLPVGNGELIDSAKAAKRQKIYFEGLGGREKENEIGKVENPPVAPSATVETKLGREESKGSERNLDKELLKKRPELDSTKTEAENEKEENPLESAIKKEELKRIMDEVNDLNKTKSQMIWLLKQVITAEKKRGDTTTKKVDPDPGQLANKR